MTLYIIGNKKNTPIQPKTFTLILIVDNDMCLLGKQVKPAASIVHNTLT